MNKNPTMKNSSKNISKICGIRDRNQKQKDRNNKIREEISDFIQEEFK